MLKFISILFFGFICIGWSWPSGWDSGLIDGGQYGTIIPATDNSYDIGSTSRAWKNIYVDGSIYTDGNLPIVGGTGIGIGTATPAVELDVVGNIRTTKLGINTTSPSAKIDVINSGSETLFALGQSASGDVVKVDTGVKVKNVRVATGAVVTNSGATLTLTGANMAKNAIFQETGTTAATFTLDTGTNLSAAVPGVAVGDCVSFVVSNASNQTITMAGATGTTLANAMTVLTLQSRTFYAINTGTNTWTIY